MRSLSTTSRARNIDREEPCFITKSVSYTHERAHWVNAVRNDPIAKEQVVRILSSLLPDEADRVTGKSCWMIDVSFMDSSNWMT